MNGTPLSWFGIVRLGLVQTALGAVVVLTTSTINRVMVVELALPAMLPGFLVALHYGVQMLRPRWGHGSDMGGRRTPWIVGGMAVLALGGFGASVATAWMAVNFTAGLALAVLSFFAVGIGVGASGTTLLALLAKRVAPERRPAASSLVWMMMIAGFVVTAGVAGRFLDPFSLDRLVAVTGAVSLAAFILALAAVWGIEDGTAPQRAAGTGEPENRRFQAALREVWSDTKARAFTIFVFVSMVAYCAQDLILEPYAGLVFGLTPGQTTQLSGLQHAGVLAGMIVFALLGRRSGGSAERLLGRWVMGGCLASAACLLGLAISAAAGPAWPLELNVFALGFANGAFAVAAIAAMMGLASQGGKGREGVRMGLWGAAQAIAFGLGGFLGAASVDVLRAVTGEIPVAYAAVFAVEGAMFIVAARLAGRLARSEASIRDAGILAARQRGALALTSPGLAQTGMRT